MEFLYVKYFRSRYVFLDGNRIGRTNKPLRVEAGSHRVDLGEDKNYAPEFQKMATSFHLPKDQVDALRRIGPTLMEQSDDFKKLVRDLGAVEN
jgi:hypothetical protein